MKTIAIISNQAFSIINFRGLLIKDIVGKNIKVYALAPDYDNEFRRQVLSLGAYPIDYQLARTGMNPVRDILDMFKLANLLRNLRPDVAVAYTIKPVIYGLLAAWIVRVPFRVAMIEGLGYIFTSSSYPWTRKRKWLRSVVSWLYRIALNRVHRAIFLNRDDINEFVDAGLVDISKVVYVRGIGIDLLEWVPVPIFKESITFLLAARLLREKGVIEYAEAARKVKALHPSTRFILLGALDVNPGGLSSIEVETWVKEGLLEWPGHVDVKLWMAQASVFVLPSYREGLPRSTQEAMAMGLPIITTDAPGCRETVEQGRNGFMVPVRDIDALARAMLFFVRQPDSISPMGAASRCMAEEMFDVHKINSKILATIVK
jgi:glycosyltransferase involved in cell wall biosynthesis